jgi:hypothetical protein
MYSLICRNAKVSLIPSQVQAQAEKRMSSFRLKLPTTELERSIKVKEKLESSLLMKKLLLGLVLFGTAMFISNGVITPAMSGLFFLHMCTMRSIIISYIFFSFLYDCSLFGTILFTNFFLSLNSVVCCEWLESWDTKCLTR